MIEEHYVLRCLTSTELVEVQRRSKVARCQCFRICSTSTLRVVFQPPKPKKKQVNVIDKGPHHVKSVVQVKGSPDVVVNLK